jgi:hypothetical protein
MNHCRSYAAFAVSVDMLPSSPARRPMSFTFFADHVGREKNRDYEPECGKVDFSSRERRRAAGNELFLTKTSVA